MFYLQFNRPTFIPPCPDVTFYTSPDSPPFLPTAKISYVFASNIMDIPCKDSIQFSLTLQEYKKRLLQYNQSFHLFTPLQQEVVFSPNTIAKVYTNAVITHIQNSIHAIKKLFNSFFKVAYVDYCNEVFYVRFKHSSHAHYALLYFNSTNVYFDGISFGLNTDPSRERIRMEILNGFEEQEYWERIYECRQHSLNRNFDHENEIEDGIIFEGEFTNCNVEQNLRDVNSNHIEFNEIVGKNLQSKHLKFHDCSDNDDQVSVNEPEKKVPNGKHIKFESEDELEIQPKVKRTKRRGKKTSLVK